jgi:hypothetical protein
VYVELETRADPHYDSTGLHRVHVNTCATAAAAACVALRATAGPSAGPPQGEGGIGAFEEDEISQRWEKLIHPYPKDSAQALHQAAGYHYHTSKGERNDA